jgi:hypothetical protein
MTTDDVHHLYRGEDLERYRAALYAQWLAERSGVAISDALTDPDRITVEYDADDRVIAVIFYTVGKDSPVGIDVRVRLPGTAPCPDARD